MELILDGKKESITEEKDLISKTIDYIQKIESKGHVVKHFYINGQSEPNFWGVLENSFKDYDLKKVEVITADTEVLIDETLNTAVNYLDKLCSYIDNQSKELKAEKGELDTLFAQLEESLKWITEALSGLQGNLQDYSLEDKMKLLFENIRKLEAIMKENDRKALGEFLEKDMKKCLLDIRARLAGIHEKRKEN